MDTYLRGDNWCIVGIFFAMGHILRHSQGVWALSGHREETALETFCFFPNAYLGGLSTCFRRNNGIHYLKWLLSWLLFSSQIMCSLKFNASTYIHVVIESIHCDSHGEGYAEGLRHGLVTGR